MTLRQLYGLFRLVLVAWETTLAFVVALLVGTFLPAIPAHWGVLFVVTGLAALASGWWERVGAEDGTRWPTLLTAGVVLLWATKAQAGGGVWPWSGWGRLGTLFGSNGVQTYCALLLATWCWWRGLGLLDREHSRLLIGLRRSVVGLVILGGLVALIGAFADETLPQTPLFIGIVAFVGLGLTAVALARIVGDVEAGILPHSGRSLRTSLFTVVALLGVGVGVLALFSGTAADVLRTGLIWALSLFTLLITPLLWLLYQIAQFIATLFIGPPGRSAPPVNAPPPRATSTASDQVLVDDTMVRVVGALPIYVLALVPLVLLIIAVLMFNRRRERQVVEDGETHESLWSWRALGQELGGLWRRRGGSGLRARLAALVARDPVTRIRRRYVQALLAGEAAALPRQPAQTPQEYGAVLNAVVPGQPAAVQTLTQRYQRAKYAPEITTSADADAADAAWQQLETKE